MLQSVSSAKIGVAIVGPRAVEQSQSGGTTSEPRPAQRPRRGCAEAGLGVRRTREER